MKQQRPVFSAASVACTLYSDECCEEKKWKVVAALATATRPTVLSRYTDGQRRPQSLSSEGRSTKPPSAATAASGCCRQSEQAASKSTTEKEGHYEHHPQKGRRGEPLVESELGHGQEGARGKEGGKLHHQLGPTTVGQLV